MQINFSGDMGLNHLQTRIISGAFDLKETNIGALVTPIHRVFALSIDTVMDDTIIEMIKEKGYSRVPVYYGENKSFIIGVLIVKSLIGLAPN
jgi:metal transporter CNNM